MNSLNFSKVGVKQIDQADCGVACVLTVLNFFEINVAHETIRSLVGKTASGSTLLGLKEGLENYGIQSDGYKANIEQIKKLSFPCILHTVLDNKFLHFIVLFKYENENFILFDPANGLISLTENQLEDIWKSKRLLLVESLPDKSKINNGRVEVDRRNIYIQLLLLFKKYQNFLVVAGLLGIFISVLNLSLAVFTQSLVDRLLLSADRYGILLILLLVFTILIVKCLLNYGRNYLLLVQSKSFNSEIIESFFGKLMFLPLTFFEAKSTGDLTTRLHDTIRIQTLMTTFFGQTIIDYFILLSISVFLLIHSFVVGSIVILAIVIFIFLSFSFRTKIIDSQKKTMTSYALSESVFIDSITGSETIKSYSKEGLFTSLIRKVYGIFQDNFFGFGVFKIKMSLLLEIIGTVLTAGIFWMSINEYLNHAFSLGELVAVLQVSLILQPSLLQIFISNTQIHEAVTAFNRMQEYTLLQPENLTRSCNDALEINRIQIKGLCFKYPGRSPLINDFSVCVNKGELSLIKGPSGKGKTTLFKILQKFYKPTSGEITLNDDKDISEVDAVTLRNCTGYVSQEIKVFNGSLIFNITLDDTVDPETVITFCKNIGIEEEILKFPDGYHCLIGEAGVKLSGGQKQLLGFARALYKKPSVLLLDEATSFMDKDLEAVIQNAVKKVATSMVIIVSSHGNEWDNLASNKIFLS